MHKDAGLSLESSIRKWRSYRLSSFYACASLSELTNHETQEAHGTLMVIKQPNGCGFYLNLDSTKLTIQDTL